MFTLPAACLESSASLTQGNFTWPLSRTENQSVPSNERCDVRTEKRKFAQYYDEKPDAAMYIIISCLLPRFTQRVTYGINTNCYDLYLYVPLKALKRGITIMILPHTVWITSTFTWPFRARSKQTRFIRESPPNWSTLLNKPLVIIPFLVRLCPNAHWPKQFKMHIEWHSDLLRQT